MNISRFFSRAGLAALAIAMVGGVALAAHMSFSTGASFLPGYRLIDGTDLNVMVTATNTLIDQAAGTTPVGSPQTIGGAAPNVNAMVLTAGATGVEPTQTVGGASADTNIGIVMAGKGTGGACLGGTTCATASLESPTTASAVNHVVITGKATGTVPTISSGGSGADANLGLEIGVTGTGTVSVGGTTAATSSLKVATAASQVDQINIAGSVTGTPGTPTISAVGTDTNINVVVTPKGTGSLVPTGGISAASQNAVVQTVSPRLIGACGQAGLNATTATANAASTDVYISEIFVPANVSTTGVAVLNGTTANGNNTIYLADVAGNQVAHTASTAVSGTSTYQLIAWVGGPIAVNGPGTYYLYFTNSATSNTWETINTGSCGTALVTGATYGTFKTTTPPTTFTTAQGPSGSLY